MLKFSKIDTKVELINILKKNNIDSQFISFVNKEGVMEYVYMVKHDDNFYSEDVVGGFISYNKDGSWSAEEVLSTKKDRGYVEPFKDGVLYDLDVYPNYANFVGYPITDVEFLDEDTLLLRLIEGETKSFYDGLIR